MLRIKFKKAVEKALLCIASRVTLLNLIYFIYVCSEVPIVLHKPMKSLTELVEHRKTFGNQTSGVFNADPTTHQPEREFFATTATALIIHLALLCWFPQLKLHMNWIATTTVYVTTRMYRGFGYVFMTLAWLCFFLEFAFCITLYRLNINDEQYFWSVIVILATLVFQWCLNMYFYAGLRWGKWSEADVVAEASNFSYIESLAIFCFICSTEPIISV